MQKKLFRRVFCCLAVFMLIFALPVVSSAQNGERHAGGHFKSEHDAMAFPAPGSVVTIHKDGAVLYDNYSKATGGHHADMTLKSGERCRILANKGKFTKIKIEGSKRVFWAHPADLLQ